jgi:hypothetical protein
MNYFMISSSNPLINHRFTILEEEVRFVEEGRVVHKKQVYILPKPVGRK